jgi:hypothetical protein
MGDVDFCSTFFLDKKMEQKSQGTALTAPRASPPIATAVLE